MSASEDLGHGESRGIRGDPPRLMPILAESGIELAGPPEIIEIHTIIKR
jgi:hypothetical protein